MRATTTTEPANGTRAVGRIAATGRRSEARPPLRRRRPRASARAVSARGAGLRGTGAGVLRRLLAGLCALAGVRRAQLLLGLVDHVAGGVETLVRDLACLVDGIACDVEALVYDLLTTAEQLVEEPHVGLLVSLQVVPQGEYHGYRPERKGPHSASDPAASGSLFARRCRRPPAVRLSSWWWTPSSVRRVRWRGCFPGTRRARSRRSSRTPWSGRWPAADICSRRLAPAPARASPTSSLPSTRACASSSPRRR